MFYASVEDLPVHCLMNLPVEAQRVYRDAFNRAWQSSGVYRVAQMKAWSEVRTQFEKDRLSGRWVPRMTARKRSRAVPRPRRQYLDR